MNPELARQHRLVNTLQSVLLIAAMVGLLGLLGWIIAGPEGLLVALSVGMLVAGGNRTRPYCAPIPRPRTAGTESWERQA